MQEQSRDDAVIRALTSAIESATARSFHYCAMLLIRHLSQYGNVQSGVVGLWSTLVQSPGLTDKEGNAALHDTSDRMIDLAVEAMLDQRDATALSALELSRAAYISAIGKKPEPLQTEQSRYLRSAEELRSVSNIGEWIAEIETYADAGLVPSIEVHNDVLKRATWTEADRAVMMLSLRLGCYRAGNETSALNWLKLLAAAAVAESLPDPSHALPKVQRNAEIVLPVSLRSDECLRFLERDGTGSALFSAPELDRLSQVDTACRSGNSELTLDLTGIVCRAVLELEVRFPLGRKEHFEMYRVLTHLLRDLSQAFARFDKARDEHANSSALGRAPHHELAVLCRYLRYLERKSIGPTGRTTQYLRDCILVPGCFSGQFATNEQALKEAFRSAVHGMAKTSAPELALQMRAWALFAARINAEGERVFARRWEDHARGVVPITGKDYVHEPLYGSGQWFERLAECLNVGAAVDEQLHRYPELRSTAPPGYTFPHPFAYDLGAALLRVSIRDHFSRRASAHQESSLAFDAVMGQTYSRPPRSEETLRRLAENQLRARIGVQGVRELFADVRSTLIGVSAGFRRFAREHSKQGALTPTDFIMNPITEYLNRVDLLIDRLGTAGTT